ncbi:hypothetical protein EB105725_31_00270 [Shimwellia blattae DSM 4481 = NBRC 105725]|nr:hypothetical protein EB105725_31_00270 [Shimwellia blattae DSM 4481 = NBRC 105725]
MINNRGEQCEQLNAKKLFFCAYCLKKRPHEKGDTFLKRDRITMTFHNWYTFRYTTESLIRKSPLYLMH